METAVMSIPTIIPTQPASKPKIEFLGLPLEIRLMIYSLLAKELQPLTGPRYVHEEQTMPEGVLGPYCSAEQLEEWIENKKTLEYILCTIRRCNKQMSREIADFVTYPRLGLCIVVDYAVKPMLSEAIADCLQDSFAPDYTVAVALYNKCLKGIWGCRHKTKNDKMFGDKRPKYPKLMHAFDRTISTLVAPAPVNKEAWTKGMLDMEGFKKLEWFHVSVNHGDLMEWFVDPVEEFKTLLPWVKKGVLVTIAVDYDLDIKGTKHDVYSKTVECLEKGGGELVLEKFDREKYGMKLVLRAEQGVPGVVAVTSPA